MMRSGWRTGLLALICLGLVACATKAPMPEQLAATDLANQGLVVGSITRPPLKPAFNSYALLFRNIDSKQEYRVRISADMMSGRYEDDILDQGVAGSKFALLLPPGRYELYNFSLFMMDPAGGDTTYFAKQDFSVPFAVQAGEIQYIGEFRNKPVTYIRSFMGMEAEILAGGSWDIYDNSGRDLGRMETRFPGLAWSDAKVKLLNPRPELMLLVRRAKEEQ
ncbi:hypothetical protein [Pseudaeromonas paramecii]|uniref:Lipoprotein n=1 Tax=Pseudaeromonas paramecii TaxID=2138166 RepID=A0ABP8QHU9_9GAMM